MSKKPSPPRKESPAKTLPREEVKQLVRREIRQQVSFSGPVPPPELLRGYESIVPGAAERILKMAEKAQRHTEQCEKEYLQYIGTGQRYGLCIASLCIISATILGLAGYETAASIIGGTTVVGLVGAFIYGMAHQHKAPNGS